MVNYISLKEFGTIISTEEYLIDKNNNNIITEFKYTAENINDNIKYIEISSDLSINKFDLFYNNSIKYKLSNNTISNTNFNSKNINRLDKYIDYINNIDKDKLVLPAKVYNYSNSTTKMLDSYSIDITVNNKDINIGPIPRNCELLVDGNTAIARDDNNIINYIFFNNGYRVLEVDKDNITRLDIISFNEDNTTNITKLHNITTSPLMNTEDLNIIAGEIDYNKTKHNISYDKYGIINNISNDNMLYEVLAYDDSKLGEIDIISSIHKLYYDNFNIGLDTSKDIYCLDQLDFETAGDRFITYTKQIAIIDKDKLSSFIEALKYANEQSDHPMIKYTLLLPKTDKELYKDL